MHWSARPGQADAHEIMKKRTIFFHHTTSHSLNTYLSGSFYNRKRFQIVDMVMDFCAILSFYGANSIQMIIDLKIRSF